MTGIYWRPIRVPKPRLVLVALLALLVLVVVENCPQEQSRTWVEAQLRAAHVAQSAFAHIRACQEKRGYIVDPEVDPAGSGLIGTLMTPVTTVAGNLSSKQTSINPNFAALIVDWLVRAGVEPADRVAVGCSGSFPALNICALAAIEALGAEAIIISSASASQWGANDPNFLWPDMERELLSAGILTRGSIAASIGGYEDIGLGMTPEARGLVEAALRRNGLEILSPSSFTEGIEQRMQLYHSHSAGQPIGAYINIGGGAISVGRSDGKHAFQPGLTRRPHARAMRYDSVMSRFLGTGVPVIHLIRIEELAERNGLPIAPTETPRIGEGQFWHEPTYDHWLVGSLLALLVFALFAAAPVPPSPILLGELPTTS